VVAGESEFFRRFRFPDAHLEKVLREIAGDQAAIACAAEASPVTVEALIRLGFNLTPLGREAEAVAYLESALAMARQLGEPGQEIRTLLHLGTARQYLGEHEQAQLLFGAGLAKSAEYGIDDQVHYLLHHRGRCYAEQGQLHDARACLEQALTLRQQIGDPRFIASSQDALAELAQLLLLCLLAHHRSKH